MLGALLGLSHLLIPVEADNQYLCLSFGRRKERENEGNVRNFRYIWFEGNLEQKIRILSIDANAGKQVS
jgi:hypothetical protein